MENKNLLTTIKTVTTALLTSLIFTSNTYASTIKGSKLYTGTTKIFTDLSDALIVLAPIVGGAFVVYFFLRRSHSADDQERKAWDKKITGAFIGIIGAISASAIIKVVIAYYQ